MLVRTRIAPSPTGEFHIGGLRTFIYNYALAKKNGGQIIIRVEDTDRTRYVEGSDERLLDVIRDYGFTWDEGPRVGGEYGPYIQSQRTELYRKYAKDLVDNGHAYYCFCTSERLAELRKQQQDQKLPVTKYDRHCVHLSSDEVAKKLADGAAHVIRLKLPENETISFVDEILGEVSYNTNDMDDQVLLKSDGFPTYHLAVVVDDHLMKITHIIRAMEWLPSTPKHIILYRAFGWEIPKIAHLSDLKEINSDKKLSKRDGSVAAADFLKEGYLPEAINNFLMFLGWNPGTEQEFFTMSEFVEAFSLDKVNKSFFSSFDRTKLLWFNGQYLRKFSVTQLWDRLNDWAEKYEVMLPSKIATKEFNLKVLGLVQERLTKLSDFVGLAGYFYFFDDSIISRINVFEFIKDAPAGKELVLKFYGLYQSIPEASWTSSNLDKLSHEALETFGYKPKEAFMTLRLIITGEKATPPLFEVMEVLTKDEVLTRLSYAL